MTGRHDADSPIKGMWVPNPLELGLPAMVLFRVAYRRVCLPLWLALSATAGLVAVSISVLCPRTPNHTTPPFEFGKRVHWYFPLEISPDPIDFGSLREGESAQASVEVQNPGKEAVTLVGVEAYCPCVQFSPTACSIGSHETRRLNVRVDHSDDPGFVGRLVILVIGRVAGGGVGFRTSVRLNRVRTREERTQE